MTTAVFQIEGTGGEPPKAGELEDFFFRHLVLPADAELTDEELKNLAETHQVDFISKEEEGNVSFIHVSRPEHLDSIQENGLIANETGYIGDLGTGVYVINQYDTDGIENVLNYIEGAFENEEEVLLVEGSYDGKMTRCIYGEGHVGYIVIKSTISADNIEDWAIKSLEDVWFTGLEF